MNDRVLPKPVVVGIDGGPTGSRALEYAVTEARALGAPLRVVHVPLQPPVYPGPGFAYALPAIRGYGQELLDLAVDQCHEQAPDLQVEGSLPHGSRVGALLHEARDAQLVVLGRRSGHLPGTSTSAGVAARSSCPVVVVPSSWTGDSNHGRIVVGMDSHMTPGAVLQVALDKARSRNAALVVVHAWRPSGAYEHALAELNEQVWQVTATAGLSNLFDRLTRDYPDVTVTYDLRWEHPGDALVSAVEKADLLLLGQHHSTLPGHRLGAVAHAALRNAECPVEIVPDVPV
jgi:nucleotide-binding universal stress UspA family protein